MRKALKGALLLNLGTPDAPRTQEVRKYLKEFLMDPLVLDIPFVPRWLLVHLAILPKRPATSAAAYQKVWTQRGSPLLVHLLDLTQKVQKALGAEWSVKPAMRYGSPSIQKALEEFQKEGIQDIVLIPLYPQFSLAATESSLREVRRISQGIAPQMRIRYVESFYKHDKFITSFSEMIEKSMKDYSYDHLLFSFHGLPERQVKKTDPTGNHCFGSSTCCDQGTLKNPQCYRAHCFETARLIAQRLGLSQERYTVCFQSRLGRTPWIKPYTDELYQELPGKGVKKLAVACPAFVADCLETLEEVQIRGKEDFIRAGGEDLRLVPSLNSEDVWVQGVCDLIRDSTLQSELG